MLRVGGGLYPPCAPPPGPPPVSIASVPARFGRAMGKEREQEKDCFPKVPERNL